ncbi:ImmA/IrrE family metallo-endopeptidase [Companilactobacillus mishanensis]|uniref:ImmA/IrrE family metallo-endopeptidase n=1 Tax=Companilactobacillus mishanensis TaxID=2486008 RepID=UPI000F7ABD34|nr:ImmA/IrrE family metallo-endopeptidase [Companilactobacillus mishanensis]
MINEITSSLMNYAFDHGFTVIFENKLSSHTPSLVDTDHHTIIVNSNWHKQNQIPFHLAHELGHLLNNDHANSCLYFTPLKNGIEGRANKKAIDLLIPYYIEDKLPEQINNTDFMKSFDIPAYLSDIVNEELQNIGISSLSKH